MKILVKALIMIFGLLACSAQAETVFTPRLYLGAGAGISDLDPDTNDTAFSVDDGNDFGYKLFIGYDLFERFSLEVYYADLGEATLEPFGDVSYEDYGISAVYYLLQQDPAHQGWGLYGRAGIGWMDNDSDVPFNRQNDNHFLFGAGGEYGFANRVSVRVEVEFFDEDSVLGSVNLLYRH